MVNFESFYQSLTSDEQWFENVSSRHKPETFKNVCSLVWTLALSDAEQMKLTPIADHRRHVVYKLSKILPDRDNSKQWFQLEEEKKEADEKKEWVPLTGEARMQKLKEWEAKIKEVEMQSAVPIITHKQAVEEGGWLPPKGPVHPVTTPMEAYIKDRRIAYIEYAYEPRTAEKKPGVMSEEQFNYEYDEILLNKEGR
jgi:hypothetical protein